jgi:hypothetical protein
MASFGFAASEVGGPEMAGGNIGSQTIGKHGKRAGVKPVHKNNSRHHIALEFNRVGPSKFATKNDQFF